MISFLGSFQKAKLVHRTIQDRAKLLRLQTRKKKNNAAEMDFPAANATPLASQVLQPRRMRALEKHLKEQVEGTSMRALEERLKEQQAEGTSKTSKLDFNAFYNGNLLRVEVNHDSDSSESSKDSFEDL